METLLAMGLHIKRARASEEYFILKKYPSLGKKSYGFKSEEKVSKISKSSYIWWILQTTSSFFLCLLDRVSMWQLKNKRPTCCHLLFYFTSYALNMFRTLIYPSSGACDYSVELQHWSYRSWFDVCWSFGVVGLAVLFWVRCVLEFRCSWVGVVQLQPATRIPLQPNHTETPTHIEPRTIRPMW